MKAWVPSTKAYQEKRVRLPVIHKQKLVTCGTWALVEDSTDNTNATLLVHV